MGLIESDHPDVPSMKGLHLFHFALSNCSQRVRLGLEEKGLRWTSHHLNLAENEHVTSDYQRINPRGVVPTLVHDGRVVTESNDILFHLDEHFPDPPLQPAEPVARDGMCECIVAASEFQPTIKVLAHELLLRPFRRVGKEELALFEARHSDPALVAFMRDYGENGAAWKSRVEDARRALDVTVRGLDETLRDSAWLSGDRYGLADISWVVNANRLNQARVDLSAWRHFADWSERAMARPAFERAVASYQP